MNYLNAEWKTPERNFQVNSLTQEIYKYGTGDGLNRAHTQIYKNALKEESTPLYRPMIGGDSAEERLSARIHGPSRNFAIPSTRRIYRGSEPVFTYSGIFSSTFYLTQSEIYMNILGIRPIEMSSNLFHHFRHGEMGTILKHYLSAQTLESQEIALIYQKYRYQNGLGTGIVGAAAAAASSSSSSDSAADIAASSVASRRVQILSERTTFIDDVIKILVNLQGKCGEIFSMLRTRSNIRYNAIDLAFGKQRQKDVRGSSALAPPLSIIISEKSTRGWTHGVDVSSLLSPKERRGGWRMDEYTERGAQQSFRFFMDQRAYNRSTLFSAVRQPNRFVLLSHPRLYLRTTKLDMTTIERDIQNQLRQAEISYKQDWLNTITNRVATSLGSTTLSSNNILQHLTQSTKQILDNTRREIFIAELIIYKLLLLSYFFSGSLNVRTFTEQLRLIHMILKYYLNCDCIYTILSPELMISLELLIPKNVATIENFIYL